MAGQTGNQVFPGLEDVLESLAILNENATNSINTKFNQLSEQNRQLREHIRELHEHSRDQAKELNVDQLMEQNVPLQEQVRELEEEIRIQLEKLEKAERDLREMENNRHGLQPARIPLTTDQATTEFKAWCINVEHWIINHIQPVMTDPARLKKALEQPREDTLNGSLFYAVLENDRGLSLAAHLDSATDMVMSACIFRWLMPFIFGRGCRDIHTYSFELLDHLEQARIEKGTETLYALQNWKAESYHALLDTPLYKLHRRVYVRNTANNLANNLGMFAPLTKNGFDRFSKSIETEIIEPGLSLREQMMSSRQEFEVRYFNVSPSAEDQKGKDPQKDFGQPELEWETYHDVTDNMSRLRPDRIYDPKLLQILGAVSPCLSTRTIQGNVWQRLECCVKQERLIAFKEGYGDFWNRQNGERQEKNQGPTFFSQFARWGPDY